MRVNRSLCSGNLEFRSEVGVLDRQYNVGNERNRNLLLKLLQSNFHTAKCTNLTCVRVTH